MSVPAGGSRTEAVASLLRRLGMPAGAQLELVFLIGSLAVAVVLVIADRHVGQFVVSLIGTAAVLLSLWRPWLGTAAVAALAGAYLMVPREAIGQGAGLYVGFILIQSLVRRGHARVAAAFVAWYLIALTVDANETASKTSPTAWFPAFLFFAVLAALAWAGGQWMVSVRRAYTAQRSLALLEQRRLIARELHDGVAQQLTRVVMRTEQAKLHGGATDEDLRFIHDACAESIRDLRACSPS